jgi:hypothetical protein
MPKLAVIVTTASPERPTRVQEGRVSVSGCSHRYAHPLQVGQPPADSKDESRIDFFFRGRVETRATPPCIDIYSFLSA